MTTIFTKNKKRPIRSRYHKIITPDGRKMDAHRYAMECQIGRRLERWEEVRHRNGDTHDNSIGNLELLTKEQHCKEHGFGTKVRRQKPWSDSEKEQYRIRFSGERGNSAKLTQAQADEIRRRAAAGETNASLARAFNISDSCISRIRTGKAFRVFPVTMQQAA